MFGEIEVTKRIVFAKSRGQAKARMVVKAFALFAAALQALSAIIEAITKIVRSFISQCIMQSRHDFFIDLIEMNNITNGWQNKCVSKFSLLHPFL